MNPIAETALANLFLALADDELILGHRNAEWTGHAPILEEDIAFANIALDELGHAQLWYDQYERLTGHDPDAAIFFRDADQYRNVRLVELPRGDWAATMLRQYIFDTFELVRAEHWANSSYRPLAEVIAKIRLEEIYHVRHTENWLRRLGLGTPESHLRTQAALEAFWPYVAQLFQPFPECEHLVMARAITPPEQLMEAWQERVYPFLESVALEVPPLPAIPMAGRDSHTPYLASLLQELQEVARLDPEAEW